MKHLAKLAVMTMAAVMLMTMFSSCSKAEFIPQEEVLVQEPTVAVYDFELEIVADGATEAVVEFRDDNLNLVSYDSYPTNADIKTSFSSQTKPAWIYSDGLQNGDPAMGGMLRISEQSIQTKADGNRKIVLLIKKQ